MSEQRLLCRSKHKKLTLVIANEIIVIIIVIFISHQYSELQRRWWILVVKL